VPAAGKQNGRKAGKRENGKTHPHSGGGKLIALEQEHGTGVGH